MSRLATTNLLLLFVAFVWGFGFVPQRLGMEYLQPTAFNALRFAIGALTLLPFIAFTTRISPDDVFNLSSIGLGSFLGFLLFLGATLQQMSLQFTSIANVAFISGLYVIIVPIVGFFIGYRYKFVVWLGGGIAITGMYLMTGSNGQIAFKGDLLALAGAVFWAIHLLALARQKGNHKQLVIAFYQFAACATFSALLTMLIGAELFSSDINAYFWPLLNGVLVVGIAYTLQVVVMKHAEPFLASLILSLEAVFGALAGYLVFSERLGEAAVVGAIMMLLGCVLAQVPGSQRELKLSDTNS